MRLLVSHEVWLGVGTPRTLSTLTNRRRFQAIKGNGPTGVTIHDLR